MNLKEIKTGSFIQQPGKNKGEEEEGAQSNQIFL